MGDEEKNKKRYSDVGRVVIKHDFIASKKKKNDERN